MKFDYCLFPVNEYYTIIANGIQLCFGSGTCFQTNIPIHCFKLVIMFHVFSPISNSH